MGKYTTIQTNKTNQMNKTNQNKHTPKLNNSGSTLILVLVIVSFIAILGTVSISTAMINLKMKATDKEAKKTFYTAEEAIDEIYIGLGKLSMESLNTAYTEELSSITQDLKVGSQSVSYKVDNTKSNTNLRQNFTRIVASKVLNISPSNILLEVENQTFADPLNKTSLIATLNSYLEHSDKAKVMEVGNIYIKKVESPRNSGLGIYTIGFENCRIQYVQDTTGYFSEVTFNGVIELPDLLVQFSKDPTDGLKTFMNYALIGNSSIEISENKKLELNGDMYAGGAGLNLAIGSTLNAENSTIVTSADINLTGATFHTLGNSNIWCTSLNAKKGSKSTIKIDSDSHTYVKDDLQIDGDSSEVSISGDYYGYSYEGNELTPKGHSVSSAIIVNGQGAKVDLSHISTLVLGGRAYIDFEGAATYTVGAPYHPLDQPSYMTGQSLALKGDQEAYLVPSSLIIKKDVYISGNTRVNMSNPVSTTKFSNALIDITADNFFGFKFLNSIEPYKTVTVNNQVYIYLNFSSKEASANYFKAIINNAAFDALCDSSIKSNVPVYQAYQDTRNYMRSILEVNMAMLAQTSIVSNSSSNISTNGSLINADLGTGIVSDVNTSNIPTSPDVFTLNSTDLSSRYKLITKILYSPPMYILAARNIYTEVPNDIIINGYNYNISTLDPADVFGNIINRSHLQSIMSSYSQTYGDNIMYATKENVTIDTSSSYNGGIIISEGTVTVNKNFKGLIIANKIYVNGNASVSSGISGYSNINGYTSVEQFLDLNGEFRKFFKAYNTATTVVNPSGETESISGVTFKDIVKFADWKKTGISKVEGK